MGTTIPGSAPKIQVIPSGTLEIPTGSQKPVTIKNVGRGVLNVTQVKFTNTRYASPNVKPPSIEQKPIYEMDQR